MPSSQQRLNTYYLVHIQRSDPFCPQHACFLSLCSRKVSLKRDLYLNQITLLAQIQAFLFTGTNPTSVALSWGFVSRRLLFEYSQIPIVQLSFQGLNHQGRVRFCYIKNTLLKITHQAKVIANTQYCYDILFFSQLQKAAPVNLQHILAEHV